MSPMRPILQRFFGVDPGRNVLRVAHRQTATVQQSRPVGLFVDGEVRLHAGFWRHDNQAIAQQRFAGYRINRFFSAA